MKNLIKLEELGQLVLAILLFSQLDYAWWLFPACLLLPDLSMIGYAAGPKVGAFFYNLFHHKFLAVIVFSLGILLHIPVLAFAGTILFGHSAMDRIFGYGLKYNDGFQHTHLGRIGK